MVFVLGPIAALAVSYAPLGRAVIDRLRGSVSNTQLWDMQDELVRLGDQMAERDHRIDELHERRDFTERMLSRGSSVPDGPDDSATQV